MRVVVVTSIDPAVNRGTQMRALMAWNVLGAHSLSVNTPRDAALLRRKGLEDQNYLEISPRDTWLDATGRATPLIAPLLRLIAVKFPDHALVITAPGIIPAIDDAPTCLKHWLDAAPALALTAEFAPLPELYRFSSHAPQRNGLAAFVLGPDKILPLADRLARWPLADEMCLGDAGWDLLLGGAIADPAFEGMIADGAVLLTEHPPSARGTAEPHPLSPYIKPLRDTGLGASPAAADLIAECRARIAQACKQNAGLSAEIKAFHFDPILPPEDLPTRCTELAQSLQYMIPWVRWNYDLPTLALLAHRVTETSPLPFPRMCDALCTGPNLKHQRSETLLAILLALRAPERPPALTVTYKTADAAKRHVTALHRLTAADTLGDPAVQLELVRLWGQEVTEDHVSNPRLQDAVALLCQNDDDRALFDAITAYCEELSDAA